MKNNKLTEIQEQLLNANRILVEEYGIGYEEMPASGEGDEYGEGDEPQEHNIAQTDNRISQIREIALEGLQDYSRNVDSEQYQFYKKIWLMCDKAVSEKDSIGEGNNA